MSEKMFLVRNNKRITPVFLAGMLMFFIFAGASEAAISANETVAKKEVKQQKNPYADAKITARIIPSANKTFGYDILVNGKTLVHQPNMPGLPGNDGFTTKEKAKTVADFVVKKIRNNEMPPTVTIEDLKKMGVSK